MNSRPLEIGDKVVSTWYGNPGEIGILKELEREGVWWVDGFTIGSNVKNGWRLFAYSNLKLIDDIEKEYPILETGEGDGDDPSYSQMAKMRRQNRNK